MELRVGDMVKIRPDPDIDPHIWEHVGLVRDLSSETHVLVELDTGEDCALYPDQMLLLPDPAQDLLNPFDVFPGPQPRDP